MRTTQINYVFRVSVRSCAGPEWITRNETRVANSEKRAPWFIAGDIAARTMSVTEKGVKVQFLGLQSDGQPVVPMGCFSVTLERDGVQS